MARGSKAKCLEILGCAWVSIRFNRAPPWGSSPPSTVIHDAQAANLQAPFRHVRGPIHSVHNISLPSRYKPANIVLLGMDGGIAVDNAGYDIPRVSSASTPKSNTH